MKVEEGVRSNVLESLYNTNTNRTQPYRTQPSANIFVNDMTSLGESDSVDQSFLCGEEADMSCLIKQAHVDQFPWTFKTGKDDFKDIIGSNDIVVVSNDHLSIEGTRAFQLSEFTVSMSLKVKTSQPRTYNNDAVAFWTSRQYVQGEHEDNAGIVRLQ